MNTKITLLAIGLLACSLSMTFSGCGPSKEVESATPVSPEPATSQNSDAETNDAPPAPSAPSASSPPPRCAIVAANDSALSALLEATLFSNDTCEWVERNAIDAILAERELQTLFGAADGPERAALGQLLKADILILARTEATEEQEVAHLVVAETLGGLRLLSVDVPLSENLEADAVAIADLVGDAIVRQTDPIREVYATPPFASLDLSHEYDYLKASYAKVLEHALMQKSGVCAVELAEAEAIAHEIALTSPGAEVSRPMPIYVLGEYRHEGSDDDPRVTISLTAKRGEEVLEECSETMPPSAAASFLQQFAQDLRKNSHASGSPPDPKAETAQLARRADLFAKVGCWKDAAMLLEAALLVRPNDIELNEQSLMLASERPDQFDVSPEGRRRRERAMNRVCALTVDVGRAPSAMVSNYLRVHWRKGMIAGHSESKPYALDEDHPRCVARATEFVELHQRLAELHAEEGDTSGVHNCFEILEWGMAPSEYYALCADFMIRNERRNIQQRSPVMSQERRLEMRSYYRRLHGDSGANAAPRRSIDVAVPLREEIAPPSRETPGLDDVPESDITFAPLTLNGEPLNVKRILRMDDGMDLILQGAHLLTLDKAGKLEPLFRTKTYSTSISTDGRYAWLRWDAKLLVLDSKTRKQWEIGPEQGLPDLLADVASHPELHRPMLFCRAYEPGKAIVFGYSGRTWLAHVTIDPEEGPRAEVFHEATEVFDHLPKDQKLEAWKNPRHVFQPIGGTLAPRRANESDEHHQFIVHRIGFYLEHHPLLVDLSSFSVEAFQGDLPRYNIALVHDACIFNNWHTPDTGPAQDLSRISWPDLESTLIAPDIGDVDLLVHDGALHAVGSDWRRFELESPHRELTPLGPTPWSKESPVRGESKLQLRLRGLWKTNHFGLVASTQEYAPGVSTSEVFHLTSVHFDGSGVSMPEAIDLHAEKYSNPFSRAFEPTVMEGDASDDLMLWAPEGVSGLCRSFTCSPDGKLIGTVHQGSVYTARLWDVESGRLIDELLTVPGYLPTERISILTQGRDMSPVAFSNSGRFAAIGSFSGDVFVFDVKNKQVVHRVQAPPGPISALAISDNGRRLVVGRQDFPLQPGSERVHVWDTAEGSELARIKAECSWIRFTPGDARLITRSMSTMSRPTERDPDTLNVYGFIQSARQVLGRRDDGRLMAICHGVERNVIAWDSEQGTAETVWRAPPFSTAEACSADGRLVLAVSKGAYGQSVDRLQVWDAETRQLVRTFPGCKSLAAIAPTPALSRDGKWLVYVGPSGRLVRRRIAFTPDAGLATDPAKIPFRSDHTPSFVEGLGYWLDSGGESKVSVDDDQVIEIDIPAGNYLVRSSDEANRAPCVMRMVEGDFLAEVTLEPLEQVLAMEAASEPVSHSSSVLLAASESNFIKISVTFAEFTQRRVLPLILVDLYQDGERVSRQVINPRTVDDAQSQHIVRFQRWGDKIRASIAAPAWPGKIDLPDVEIDWPDEIGVGLAVENLSDKPITRTFRDFNVDPQ